MHAAFPERQATVESTTEIGPTIGEKLRQDALIAVAISLVGIVLYITARFEFRFGIAAALAMVHDVLVVLGTFYVLNKEITLLVVTAVLTLAGYSLTDKVVVFDRIRETLRVRRREGLEDIDPGLAEPSELSSFDVLVHKPLDIDRVQPSRPRHPPCLIGGGCGTNVRVQAAAGCRYEIDGDGSIVAGIGGAQRRDAGFHRFGQCRIGRA